jgi:hypothetical protein
MEGLTKCVLHVFHDSRLLEIVMPRRQGKTTLLKAIGKEYNSYQVYACTPSTRASINLGFVEFDLINTPVPPNTLLLIDDYDFCNEDWKLKEKKVLEAGGLVVKTRSGN